MTTTMTMTTTSSPKCSVCDVGEGASFPLLPSNQHRKFGTICHPCDMRELRLLGQWRGGQIPDSVQGLIEMEEETREDEHVDAP